MYGLELMLSIGATISSILVGDSPTVTIFGSLIFYRFILGIGVGGDYPLSAGKLFPHNHFVYLPNYLVSPKL